MKAVVGGAAGIRWVEARNAAHHRIVPGTAPATRNDPAKMSVVPRLRNPGRGPVSASAAGGAEMKCEDKARVV